MKLKIADKTLNILLVIFVIIDIALVAGCIFIKKPSHVSPVYSKYMNQVNNYVKKLEDKGYKKVHYEKYVYNDQIMSVAIYGTNGTSVDRLEKVYNIDVDTGKELTLREILYILEIEEDSLQRQYKDGYSSFFEEDNQSYLENVANSNLSEDDKAKIINEINDIKESIEYVNYNVDVYDDFFISGGTLYIYIDNTNLKAIRKKEYLNNSEEFAKKEIEIE